MKWFRRIDKWPLVALLAVLLLGYIIWQAFSPVTRHITFDAQPENSVVRQDDDPAQRGRLGVAYTMIPASFQISPDIPQGALITEVIPGYPADEAGIRVGDIITRIDGRRFASLQDTIMTKRPGTEVTLEILSQGEIKTFTVILAEAPTVKTR